MNLTPRELAFLEHEMGLLKDDPSNSGETRMQASAIFGKVQGEIEWEKSQHLNGASDKPLVASE